MIIKQSINLVIPQSFYTDSDATAGGVILNLLGITTTAKDAKWITVVKDGTNG